MNDGILVTQEDAAKEIDEKDETKDKKTDFDFIVGFFGMGGQVHSRSEKLYHKPRVFGG